MNCLRILKFLIRYLKEIKCRIYINISLQCSTIEHFSLCSKLVVFQGETVDQAPKKLPTCRFSYSFFDTAFRLCHWFADFITTISRSSITTPGLRHLSMHIPELIIIQKTITVDQHQKSCQLADFSIHFLIPKDKINSNL